MLTHLLIYHEEILLRALAYFRHFSIFLFTVQTFQDSDVCSLIGKVYNDIGLLYNGLKSYENAAECFELAIPLMRAENPDKNLEAVLQQNLGAVYNQLKQFNKAMECHRQAISLHGIKDI